MDFIEVNAENTCFTEKGANRFVQEYLNPPTFVTTSSLVRQVFDTAKGDTYYLKDAYQFLENLPKNLTKEQILLMKDAINCAKERLIVASAKVIF